MRIVESYGSDEPFSYLVHTVASPLLAEAAREYPTGDDAIRLRWEQAGRGHTKNVAQKFFLSDKNRLPPATKKLIDYLNGKDFVAEIGAAFDLDLIPDPDLFGGGMHMIGRGGFLMPHVDFNWHKRLGARRAVNLLLYLNEDWNPDWGGDLVLYEKTDTWLGASVIIPPTMGTMVLFETSDNSYHGHPDPLNCPPNVFRKSIALYYYVKGEAPDHIHSTIYEDKP